jgi:hypothetical protein
MPVAIVTRFLGPTNYRGARIVATVPERIADRDRDRRPGDPGYELHTAAHWRLTIPYPHELNAEEAHRTAAEALARRLEWLDSPRMRYYDSELIGGALADGYAWVFAPSAATADELARRRDFAALAALEA